MNDLYKVVWDDESDGLLFGISVVDKPANLYQTIELKEQQNINLKVENKKKKQLAGVVLIPGQKIRRYTPERGEYDVIFEADTIEKLAHNLFIGDYHKNSWYNHDRDKKVEGNTVVESWIITDANKDKAVALGFEDLPVGTWMILMQLSDEAWEEYVDTGMVKGFSIDSYMSLEKIELQESSINIKTEINMKNFAKEFLNLLKEANSDIPKKEELEMVTIEREGGNLEVEALEEGKIVSLNDSPFVDEKFVFNNKIYFTDEEGKISKIEEVEDEDLDLTDEEAKEEFFEMLDKDEELSMLLKEKYSTTVKESVNMSLNTAKSNDNVRNQFRELFLEEINASKSILLEKDEKIKELEAKLDETPSTGKLKSNMNLSQTDNKPMSGLERVRNVINKSK